MWLYESGPCQAGSRLGSIALPGVACLLNVFMMICDRSQMGISDWMVTDGGARTGTVLRLQAALIYNGVARVVCGLP